MATPIQCNPKISLSEFKLPVVTSVGGYFYFLVYLVKFSASRGKGAEEEGGWCCLPAYLTLWCPGDVFFWGGGVHALGAHLSGTSPTFCVNTGQIFGIPKRGTPLYHWL